MVGDGCFLKARMRAAVCGVGSGCEGAVTLGLRLSPGLLLHPRGVLPRNHRWDVALRRASSARAEPGQLQQEQEPASVALRAERASVEPGGCGGVSLGAAALLGAGELAGF